MIYAYTDSEGYVLYTSSGLDKNSPHNVYKLEEDIGISPDGWSKYHIINKTWIDTRTQAEKESWEWGEIVADRNKKLADTDWTQLPDVPLETKTEWATYRQELRDITDQPDPFNIVWPTPPQ
jgi:hypothetical protein